MVLLPLLLIAAPARGSSRSNFHIEFLDATKGYSQIHAERQWPFAERNEIVLASSKVDVRTLLPLTFTATMDGKTVFKATATSSLQDCRGATGCSIPGPVLKEPKKKYFSLEIASHGKVLAEYSFGTPPANEPKPEKPPTPPSTTVPAVPAAPAAPAAPAEPAAEIPAEGASGMTWLSWLAWSVLLLFAAAAVSGVLLATRWGTGVLERVSRDRVRELNERLDLLFDTGSLYPIGSVDPCEKLRSECDRLTEEAKAAKEALDEAGEKAQEAADGSIAADKAANEALREHGEARKAEDDASATERGEKTAAADEAWEEYKQQQEASAAKTQEWAEAVRKEGEARRAWEAAEQAAAAACRRARECEKEAEADRAAAGAEAAAITKAEKEGRPGSGPQDPAKDPGWIDPCAELRKRWGELLAQALAAQKDVARARASGGDVEATQRAADAAKEAADAAKEALDECEGKDALNRREISDARVRYWGPGHELETSCCPCGIWVGAGIQTGGMAAIWGYETLVARMWCACDPGHYVSFVITAHRLGVGLGGAGGAALLVAIGDLHPGQVANKIADNVKGIDGDLSVGVPAGRAAKALGKAAGQAGQAKGALGKALEFLKEAGSNLNQEHALEQWAQKTLGELEKEAGRSSAGRIAKEGAEGAAKDAAAEGAKNIKEGGESLVIPLGPGLQAGLWYCLGLTVEITDRQCCKPGC